MQEIIKINDLRKTFVLSNKQMKQNKTKDKYKKALNGLDLTINKDLQRIPLGYFNDTVDKVFLEYLDYLLLHLKHFEY